MSRPEPKFSVGEAVMIRCRLNKEFNTNHSVVIERMYRKRRNPISGVLCQEWDYKLSTTKYRWVDESAIRPIPKDKPNGIDALEWIKDLRGVEA